jgi:hypothetical protein
MVFKLIENRLDRVFVVYKVFFYAGLLISIQLSFIIYHLEQFLRNFKKGTITS